MAKEGYCENYFQCATADLREAVAISPGAEFVCPECGNKLIEQEEEPRRGLPWKIIGIGGAALLLLGVLVWAFWPTESSPPPPPDPPEVPDSSSTSTDPPPPPQPARSASFSMDLNVVNVGEYIQFEDLTAEANKWKWDFDSDGEFDSQEQNPRFKWSQPGAYTVRLVVDDSLKTSQQVEVQRPPEPERVPMSQHKMEGLFAQLGLLDGPISDKQRAQDEILQEFPNSSTAIEIMGQGGAQTMPIYNYLTLLKTEGRGLSPKVVSLQRNASNLIVQLKLKEQ